MDQQSLFKTTMFANTRKLISVIDELRDYGLDQQISLPRIAVLGTQSSGKSSLLENVVGLDFLPRGSGVVTRRPLQLRMVHVDPRKTIKPYAVFDVDKTKQYTNFTQVCKKIIIQTDKVAGTNKQIINDPIKLTIFSNDCPDLTIIDLPGITRIDFAGQKDVFRITTQMAASYCKDPNTVILCVIPGNADLATSDGLKYARDFDPEGKRTIGCITKIDIMDKGTNAKLMLSNQQIPLRLGYVGIKNRSQQDINNKVPVQKSLAQELKYFQNHPDYRDLPDSALGTKSLTNKLSQILVSRIAECLPSILGQINAKIQSYNQRLDELGNQLPKSSKQRVNFLMNMISEFTNSFKNTISGKYVAGSKGTGGAGAKIKEQFRIIYQEYIAPQYRCSTQYKEEHIDKAIKLHQGDQIDGFPSMDSFLYLMIPQIQKLKQPAYTTLQNVYIFLMELALQINTKIFSRFPDVLDLVTQITNKRLEDQKQKAKQVIDNLLSAEISVIFTNDEIYLSARNDLLAKSANSDAKKLFISQIRERLDGYFKIVVRALNDSIPKAIGFFLVKQSQDQLQMLLYNQIVSKQAVIDSLGQPKQVQQQRADLNKKIDVLKKSLKRIKKDPDIAQLLKNVEQDEEDDQ